MLSYLQNISSKHRWFWTTYYKCHWMLSWQNAIKRAKISVIKNTQLYKQNRFKALNTGYIMLYETVGWYGLDNLNYSNQYIFVSWTNAIVYFYKVEMKNYIISICDCFWMLTSSCWRCINWGWYWNGMKLKGFYLYRLIV